MRENDLVLVGEVQDDGKGGGGDGVSDSELWCLLWHVVRSLVHGSAITLETAHGSRRFTCAVSRRQPEMRSGL